MNQKTTDNLISCTERSNPRPPRTKARRPSTGTQASGQLNPAAERLEAAGQLAAWMAHQINNPLGAISGNAQLLARRLQRDVGDSDTLQAYMRHLEAIQAQTERCAAIISDALSVTQPHEPEFRRIDASKAVSEAIELVHYGRQGIEIVLDVEGSTPLVRADREWLIRVVFELLVNAIEASGGNVRVEVRKSKAEVQIRVIDSGSGMADDVRRRAFDPFFSTREKARGLGLTMGLDMMRKMNGTLEVEQSNEGGSVLTIEIPIWRQSN